MIPVLSTARLVIYGIAVAAVVAFGLYARHVYKEAKRVPALVETINAQERQRKREQHQNALALQREHELQTELAGVRDRADSLSKRLRWAYQAELSEPAPGPSEPDAAPGIGDSVDPLDAAVAGVIAACKEDSIRYAGWLQWWESVPASLKAPIAIEIKPVPELK